MLHGTHDGKTNTVFGHLQKSNGTRMVKEEKTVTQIAAD
uniref:Uncharacterized protein n=1 Tax=Sulfobacillus thermotolerans TaxID=338644 RepID=G5CJ37_9FIRM|nr:hypothetical protein [Sulfobacillus thermotolerans]